MFAWRRTDGWLTSTSCRIWRKRQINDRKTDEDHPPKWLHHGRTSTVSIDRLQESTGLRKGPHRSISLPPTRTVQPEGAGLHLISGRVQRGSGSHHSARFENWGCHYISLERSVYINSFGTSEWVLSDGLGTIVSPSFPWPQGRILTRDQFLWGSETNNSPRLRPRCFRCAPSENEDHRYLWDTLHNGPIEHTVRGNSNTRDMEYL